jgi:stringent starvation protein B
MTSSKPYLLRALYEWILDNDTTPYIHVDTSCEGLRIPSGIDTVGKVVLNISPKAVENLEMTNEYLSFSARFAGVAEDIYCPIGSLIAIYARETSEGMMFPAEPTPVPNGDKPGGDDGDGGDKPKGPSLKVVK